MDCLNTFKLNIPFNEHGENSFALSKEFAAIIVLSRDVFEACIARADKQGRVLVFRQGNAGCHMDFAVYSKQKVFI